MQGEGQHRWRELVPGRELLIAVAIALAAALALFLDARVESRAYDVGHPAAYGPRVQPSEASGLAPLASRRPAGVSLR